VLPKPFSPDELRLAVQRGFERRRLQIEAHRADLERELQRRRFVTFVTHQLKTPLVAVHQYLDLLQRLGDAPDAPAKRGEWLERCRVRIEELQRLIEDWLTLAKLEGGALGRHRTRVDLKPLIVNLLAGYQALAASRQVSLDEELPGTPCPVHGDPVCLTVLLDNLVANAIQYNHSGGSVCVRAACPPGEVVVTVQDTGAGIPREALPFLFDEFFRVRGPGHPRPPGTGLGLHICRRIVSEMGGAIEVESTEGGGSTFRVRLPVHADAPPAPTSAE
jgi:signal transduction histidine kinase